MKYSTFKNKVNNLQIQQPHIKAAGKQIQIVRDSWMGWEDSFQKAVIYCMQKVTELYFEYLVS